MGRSIYLDFGANAGETVADQLASASVDQCWAFEPNPELAAALRIRFAGQAVEVQEKAAWVENGTQPLYLGHPLSSTLMTGKVTLENWPQYAITYDRSVEVETIDTAQWIIDTVRPEDNVIMKMDIEGAEYVVLQRVIDTGAIDLIDELRCEFHPERFPKFEPVHDQLIEDLRARTKLVLWI